MVTGMCLLVLLMTKFWSETPLGQWLHRTLVDNPLAMMAGIERKYIIFLVIGLFAIQSFAMIMSADLAVLAALDLASYVDVVLGVWTIAAVTRVKGLGAWAAGWRSSRKARGLRRPAGQRTPRRQRLPMSARAPSNDDDEAAAPIAA